LNGHGPPKLLAVAEDVERERGDGALDRVVVRVRPHEAPRLEPADVVLDPGLAVVRRVQAQPPERADAVDDDRAVADHRPPDPPGLTPPLRASRSGRGGRRARSPQRGPSGGPGRARPPAPSTPRPEGGPVPDRAGRGPAGTRPGRGHRPPRRAATAASGF